MYTSYFIGIISVKYVPRYYDEVYKPNEKLPFLDVFFKIYLSISVI